MEITISILRSRYSCWTTFQTYNSCHIPHIGEKVSTDEGVFTVQEVLHKVGQHQVDLYVGD